MQQNTHSPQVHVGTFSRIANMLGHKATLSKFKNTEIISRILSNHIMDCKSTTREKLKTTTTTTNYKYES